MGFNISKNVYREENIVKQLWLTYYYSHHQKRVHMVKLEYLLKAFLKNSLKIYPKKCQLFKMELQYMGILYL